MAARFGVALPVVERMLGEYAELVSRGYGDEDISATFRLKEELFDAPAKPGASHKVIRMSSRMRRRTSPSISLTSALRAPRSPSFSSSS